MPRVRNLLVNTILLGVSLVVALVGGEGLVRFFAPQDMVTNFSGYQAHPVYRFRNRSNLGRQARWVEDYYLKTNSRGLRSRREISYEPGYKWRILVHGDSFTFGNGVEEENIFVTGAELHLHRQGFVQAELVNMGVSAHGPSLEYLYFQEEGHKYKPKVVVMALFLGNDVMDDFRDSAFRLEHGKLIYQSYTIPWIKKLTDTSLYQFLASRSHLFILVRSILNVTSGRREEEVNAYSDEDHFPDNYALTEAVLQAFWAAIRNAGAHPVLFLIPSPDQVLRYQNKPIPPEIDVFPLANHFRQRILQTCQRRA